jgi:hypothetical protein
VRWAELLARLVGQGQGGGERPWRGVQERGERIEQEPLGWVGAFRLGVDPYRVSSTRSSLHSGHRTWDTKARDAIADVTYSSEGGKGRRSAEGWALPSGALRTRAR